MLNFLWAFMIAGGVIYAACTGRLDQVTQAAFDSAAEAVALCITMAGVLAFWAGMMKIAQKAGLLKALARRLSPFLRFLFPGIPQEHPAQQAIAVNCIANVFGLGWAATPAGLEAMKYLKDISRQTPDKASDEMCTFLVLNISSLQLIPVTVIAYRSQYGSVDPSSITGMAVVATAISTGVGIIFAKAACFAGKRRRKNE